MLKTTLKTTLLRFMLVTAFVYPIIAQCVAPEKERARDTYGFYLDLEENPVFAGIPADKKKELSKTLDTVKEVNDHFDQLKELKRTIMTAWKIENSSSKAVHDAIYQLIGIDAKVLEEIPLMIEVISELSKDSDEITAAFYLPNGGLKDFVEIDRVKGLPKVEGLLKAERAELRKMINFLVIIESMQNAPKSAAMAKKALDAYQTNGHKESMEAIEKELSTIITLILNDRFKELSRSKTPQVRPRPMPTKKTK